MNAGDEVLLDIEKAAAGGRMIARLGRQVVLVADAIPGERARVRIDRVAKGVAYGRVVSIEAASQDRRTPFVDPQCGGSLFAHIAPERQVRLKAEIIADAFGRIARIPWQVAIPVVASPEEGYRMRARLHLRAGRLGFFREASHQVCEARATRQLLPETSNALDATSTALAGVGVAEAEIDVSENVDATERALHVEVLDQSTLGALRCLPTLDGISGVTASVSGRAGARVDEMFGTPFVTDHLDFAAGQVRLRRHVLSFFQGNRFLLHRLVADVVAQLLPRAPVTDLYAGVGVFSVAAALELGVRVTAVEGDPMASADLRVNAAQRGADVEAVHDSVERFVARARGETATILVDPPRTGMTRDALQGIARLQARRVVYVSCDVATLARDARALLDLGYGLSSLSGFDLFPNTPHVETLAVFDRQ